ncbi:insulinase family protein [Borrelia coriaceae]|uniref:Metalloprotease, insulinase family protein n=1 Tax=Borrelia coriaceae ATCC 43381 TaxID=1408429 RepID=W5STA5_9SPIR|nr:insulinase family protein [Borrelia coriaceae]AHH10389.1 Metalloprotease, insulinase family protein [Borrelia coriaceae ATCC 43381]UPA16097.1 insulinase family protein [Borrelia coriaceae]
MKKKKFFSLISKTYLEEYDTEGCYFKHESGLEIFELKNSKFKENAFGIAFKTIPLNNTGVAHILEHTIFCGSNKYRIKDPFLYLMKGSLSTFLNAMTFPDKTLYPAASTIQKDYFNLFKIYADAVFNPLLKKEAFMQEGYNINPTNFQLSGIVLNEMKGNYSNKNSLINEIATNSLFSEGTYQYDSGGNPINIIDLTYEEFIEFYKKHYTLENCKIFLFGNIDTNKNLNFIEKYILRPYTKTKSNINYNIDTTTRWKQGKTLSFNIPKETENTLGVYAINWLCTDIKNIKDNIGLEILSEILLDSSCQFTINMLKSEIGDVIADVSGINTDIKECVFSFGLQNVLPGKIEEFKNMVFKELKDLVKVKIPEELIQGILFGYEFSLKEEKGQGWPISLMIRSFKGWIHGMHPTETLKINYHLDEIKNKLERGEPYFENLIEKYLLNNNHYTLIHFNPSDKTLKEMEEEIAKKLMNIEINIKKNPKKFAEFTKDYNQFKEYQKKEDLKSDISKLPMLKIDDLPKEVEKSLPLNETPELKAHTFEFKQNNNIFNVHLFFKLNSLQKEDFITLSLFKIAIQDLSTKNYSYVDLNNKIQNTLGQLNIYESYEEDVQGNMINLFNISFKSFNNKIQESFILIKEILININFHNYDRLKEIVLSLKNDFKSILIPKGHIFATTRSESKLSQSKYLLELQLGITGREYWHKVKTDIESLKEIACNLENLRNKIICKDNLSSLLIGNTSDVIKRLESELSTLRENLSGKTYPTNPNTIYLSNNNLKEIIIIPSKISFNSMSFVSYKIKDENYPKINFLTHILKSGILWEKVRILGGAYGAFASITNGIFSFTSYRDPNFVKTYQAFETSLEELANNAIKNEELYTYLIGVIGLSTNVKTKSTEILESYKRKILNISDQLRQDIRNAYFKITSTDIKNISEQVLQQLTRKNSITSLVNDVTYENDKEKLEAFIGKKYKIKKIY